MILVIPAIEIMDGKCACLIQGLPDSLKTYPDNPVEVARIWRKENAKVLYLIDIDGKNLGKPQNWETIEKITTGVDIPTIVEGGFRSYEDVKRAIDMGILRIVMDIDTFKNFSLLNELVDEFTPKRIALKIEAKDGKTKEGLNAIEIAFKLKEIGMERVIYEDLADDGYINFEALRNFAISAGLKITAFGELSGYQELKRLGEVERLGLDSVVLSKCLYQNKFPCQYLWRMVELEVDL